MGKRVLVAFLLAGIAPASFFDTEVDYFKDAKEREEQTQKKENKTEYYRKLWEESVNWTPSNLSPLEREIFRNPTDPVLQDMYRRYVDYRTQKVRVLSSILTDYFQEKEKLLERLEKAQVDFIYFFSPTCPYCKMSEPTLSDISKRARKVLTVNIMSEDSRAKELMALFGVRQTPTLVALKGLQVIDVWTGAFSWGSATFTMWLNRVVHEAEGINLSAGGKEP